MMARKLRRCLGQRAPTGKRRGGRGGGEEGCVLLDISCRHTVHILYCCPAKNITVNVKYLLFPVEKKINDFVLVFWGRRNSESSYLAHFAIQHIQKPQPTLTTPSKEDQVGLTRHPTVTPSRKVRSQLQALPKNTTTR